MLTVTFPFFALVLCGYLAIRQGWLPLSAIAGLNSFVLFFALPCMLFRWGAHTAWAQLLDPVAAGVYLACGLILVGMTVVLLQRNWGWNDAAMAALVVAFPNSGFMGVPLLAALLGPASSGPVVLTIAVDMVITSSLCIALSRLGLGGAAGAWGAGRQALRGVLGNPMAWAIVLGAGASALQWTPPQPLARTIALLADAASPVALFTLGTVLARASQQPPAPRQGRISWALAVAKLLLHPLLVAVACQAVQATGVDMAPSTQVALVLVAALPSASNVLLLSERLGADSGRVARTIMRSTVAAFATFTALAALWAV